MDDGWTDRWTDGGVDRWMDGWMDGWTDGKMDEWKDNGEHQASSSSLAKSRVTSIHSSSSV